MTQVIFSYSFTQYLSIYNYQYNHIMSRIQSGGTTGAVYGLGFIGAAIYYISHAASFWAGTIGFLKAIVWPAFLVYKALEYFGG